jgi:hypothetical protein
MSDPIRTARCFALGTLLAMLAPSFALPASATPADCAAFADRTSFAKADWNAYFILEYEGSHALADVVRANLDYQLEKAAELVAACQDDPSAATFYDIRLSRRTFDINTFRAPFTLEAVQAADADLRILRDKGYYALADSGDFFLLQHNIAQYYGCLHMPFKNYVPPPKSMVVLRGQITDPCRVGAGMLKPR